MTQVVRRPTEDDIPFLAWVMYRAAQSHLDHCPFETLLEEDEDGTLSFLEKLLCTEPVHLGHYSKFWIAEVDGEPVAAASGYRPETDGMHVLAEVFLDMAAVQQEYPPSRLVRIQKRLETVRSVFPADEQTQAWGVEYVAVLPEYRGLGLTDELFEHLFTEGSEAGYEFAQILSLVGNTTAERAWRRNGFRVLEVLTDPDFEALIGAPGNKRHVRRV